MEGVSNIATTQTSAVPTPTPPMATPTPISTPPIEATPISTTPMTNQNPTMADGGSVSSEGGIKSFLKSLNWIEVGLTILGVTALIYTIHYYKFKSKEDKMVNNELQRQIDEIKMNLQSSLKGKYKSI
jgi:hypothetical protein